MYSLYQTPFPSNTNVLCVTNDITEDIAHASASEIWYVSVPIIIQSNEYIR